MEKRFIVIVVLVLGAAVLASYLQSGLTGNPIFRTERVIDLSEDADDFENKDILVSGGSGSILSTGSGGQEASPVPKTYCTCKENAANIVVRDNCANWQMNICNAMQDCTVMRIAETPEGKRIEIEVQESCEVFTGYKCGCEPEFNIPYVVYDKHGRVIFSTWLSCVAIKGCGARYGVDAATCGKSVCQYLCRGSGRWGIPIQTYAEKSCTTE